VDALRSDLDRSTKLIEAQSAEIGRLRAETLNLAKALYDCMPFVNECMAERCYPLYDKYREMWNDKNVPWAHASITLMKEELDKTRECCKKTEADLAVANEAKLRILQALEIESPVTEGYQAFTSYVLDAESDRKQWRKNYLDLELELKSAFSDIQNLRIALDEWKAKWSDERESSAALQKRVEDSRTVWITKDSFEFMGTIINPVKIWDREPKWDVRGFFVIKGGEDEIALEYPELQPGRCIRCRAVVEE
jgi:hypothetical protein